MVNQKSQLLRQTQIGIPEKWQEKYLIKRIDEENIEITLSERNAILQALNNGQRFIQVGKYTLMLNSIKSIDPKWGEDNIPPKPIPNIMTRYSGKNENGSVQAYDEVINKKEIDEWEKYFNK